jgi:hypothetical protein
MVSEIVRESKMVSEIVRGSRQVASGISRHSQLVCGIFRGSRPDWVFNIGFWVHRPTWFKDAGIFHCFSPH